MYCIECGAPIEATARICGVCRFPQPLEEFADVESASATPGAQKPVLSVRFVDSPPKRNNRARLATALAAFIALCISTGLTVYLLTRKPANSEVPVAPPPASTPQSTPSSATDAKQD